MLLIPLINSCKDKIITLLIRLSGTNHILGHRLRVRNFPEPVRKISVPYLIIGGGISGLSAARQLSKKGIDNFLLLEMEGHTGGNSSSGQNKYSKFPLGAHYLPLPNFNDKELLNFLEEAEIITGYSNGYPVFDEQQLTFSPQERLFYKNTWQEGLVPRYGNNAALESEFSRFFDIMEEFKNLKGSDGKYVFDIPLSFCSRDIQYHSPDNETMQQWLEQHDFFADELLEYINYCCRDDFGLGIAQVSAWAGIHYFAGRKHNLGTDYKDNVLTWPEGNSRLAGHLKKYTADKTLINQLAYNVTVTNGKAVVLAFDNDKKETVEITAGKVIMATPQFVNQYLIPARKEFARQFNYAPWLLATLTLKDLPDDYSYPLCWDNVIFKGAGLGYIYDQHQALGQLQEKKVITYYHSFATANSKKARREIYSKKAEYWKNFVLNDLRTAHPGIEQFAEEIDIHVLGHGMVSPVPGFIHGLAKAEAGKSINNTIYFAHSDLSGISIFEEAFHQGINAVNKMVNDAALDS